MAKVESFLSAKDASGSIMNAKVGIGVLIGLFGGYSSHFKTE